MKTKSIAIIGAGNMGGCLLNGLLANGYPENLLWISNPSTEKLTPLQNLTGKSFNITTNNIEATTSADIIILAVKPLVIPIVLHELAPIIKEKNPLIISTAAGVTESVIKHFMHAKASIVRAMPNTPAMLRCGATALYANTNVTTEERDIAESIFRAVGIVVWIEQEDQMDAVTAVSGCGPAYFFLIMEAIQNVGQSLGLSPETAQLLTLQTAYGAARMALENDKNVAELRKQVTSKGGTTEQAIHILETANIRDIFSQALSAADHRAKELANIITQQLES